MAEEYKRHTIFPSYENIFAAFKKTSYSNTTVVILGQDPYIKDGQADGLSFSVKADVTVPPSLKNIFKEINSDIGEQLFLNGCLTSWAEQGVLLLNTTLTVRKGFSNSHKKMGWEIFTDSVICTLNSKSTGVVFLLWGNDAIRKSSLISNPQHLVLTAKHPSPLARGGFFGCKHFSKTNEFLRANGLPVIDWSIK